MGNEMILRSGGALPSHLAEYAGEGKDGINEKISIPRVHLCQPNSPESEEGIGKVGDFCLRPVKLNIGRDVTVCIVATHTCWVLWNEEDTLPEFQGTKEEMEKHLPGSTEWHDDEDGERQPPTANETRMFLVVECDGKVLDPNGYGPFFVSMSKTSASVGKDINTLLKIYKGPIWGAVVQLSSELKENDKGRFAVYKAKTVGQVESGEVAKALSELHKAVKAVRMTVE